MPTITHLETAQDVAAAAADHAVITLNYALETRGHAIWVLAGGSSPMQAYTEIVNARQNDVDWSRVIVLIGDERIVPFTSDDSNWGKIRDILLMSGPTSALLQVPPPVSGSAEDAADAYDRILSDLLNLSGSIDLLWLGVGEDGHTLSLAPGRNDLMSSDKLVTAVHDFPKAPSTRISFTLTALARVREAVVFATGEAKRDSIAQALESGELPIALASKAVESAGGKVTWLFDAAASPQTS